MASAEDEGVSVGLVQPVGRSPKQAWPDQEETAPFSGCGVCCSCVPSGSVGVVQQFGRFQGYMEPGLNPFCPCIHTVLQVSLAVRLLDCRTECKTKDNATLGISSAVSYRINKQMVQKAVFDIDDPESQIRAAVDNVVRSTIPSMDLDAAYCSKAALANGVLTAVRSTMRPYGFDIVDVLLTDLSPERELLEAMNAQLAAKMHVQTAREEGEAAKILKVKAAEADAEARHLAGRGIARMRKAIAEGMRAAVVGLTEGGLPTQQAVESLILTQYLDTLKDFAANPNKSAVLLPVRSAMTQEAQLCDTMDGESAELVRVQAPEQHEMGA